MHGQTKIKYVISNMQVCVCHISVTNATCLTSSKPYMFQQTKTK